MTAPRSIWLGFFHRIPVEGLLRSLALALRPRDFFLSVDGMVQRAEAQYQGMLHFDAPVISHGQPRMGMNVMVFPRHLPPAVVMPGRRYEVLRPDTRDEVGCITVGGAFDIKEDDVVRQTLHHLSSAWPVLQPTFAYGDEEVCVLKTAGSHPERLAWPWMIYGPEMIAKWGEDHLRKAPVWRIEKLDYGGILLQVAENPFTATRRQVKALADHLGLEAPR